MKTKIAKAIAACALLGAFAFFSCDGPISLGKRLNLEPPVVTIEKPDFMENVGGMLEVTGTASDMEEIVQLSITIERVNKTGESWKQEWHAERGRWQSRAAGAPWEPQSDAVWTQQGGKGNIRWSITVDLGSGLGKAPDGEYAITVGAVNNVQNAGALVERRVVIDNEPPVVIIITPELEFVDGEDTYNFEEHVKDAFDKYNLQEPTILNRLHNQIIKVQYEIKDSFSIDTLMFQLADSQGNFYYNKNNALVESPGWNGAMTIPSSQIVDADGVMITDKLYLQLISTVTDRAGNKRILSHGWLVYWPDADKPWTQGVGHEDDPQKFPVYPRMDVQGQAYDDDGVQEVSLQIFHRSTGVPAPGYEEGPVTLTNYPMAEGASPSTFYSWSFTSPEDCDEYSIVLNCKDINGLAGDTVTRYFYVLDTSASSVEVHTPSPNETLFGNASGDFTIAGKAGDGVNPEKLAILWLNPNGGSQSQILYQSSDYEGWDSAASAGYTDGMGNKLWDVTMGTPVYDDLLKRVFRDFTLPLNLFTDLNIGAGDGQNPLTAQNFILRVEGNNGKATTVFHSVRGDIEPPQLSIANVTVGRAGVADKVYTLADLADTAMDALEPGDQISLTGAWGDDSFAHWGGTPLRMGAFEVLWNGDPVPNAALNTSPTTWTAGPLSLTDAQVLKGGGRIEVTLRDYGNNVTTAAFSARVDSNIPRLMFISSETADGAYNFNKTVDIYLEFSKAVSVEFDVDEPPFLKLTNGYTAAYTPRAGNSNASDDDPPTRHRFTYTVGNNHNADPLGVMEIHPETGWSGSGGKVALSIEALTNAKQNLQDLKNIRIDTTPPAIKGVQSLTGDAGNNYFREGRTIYLLVEFNEAINFSGSGATLTLNANTTSSGSPNTSGTVEAVSPVLSGTSALLFTYTVGSTHNTPFTLSPPNTTTYGAPLTALSFALGGATITDLAGNNFTTSSIPSNINDGASPKAIHIDTTAPAAPSFGGNSSPAGTYTNPANNPPHFILQGEDGATFEYSSNNGDSWLPYENEEVRLTATGTHDVTARQKDRAGNVSGNMTSRQYIVTTNIPMLSSLTASTPGTYKSGETITITLNLSKPITVGGSGQPNFTLSLNNPTVTTAAATAAGNTLKFTYQVASGVNTPTGQYLGITSLNQTGTANDLSNELMSEWNNSSSPWGTSAGKLLSDVSPIVIDTTSPALQGTPALSSDGQTLTLNFNKDIYKGTGSIRLVQQGTYLAPAVLTKDEYLRYGGSALDTYYTRGTNGTTSNGTADLTEKYILKYETETNNSTLTSTLIGRGANSVTIPIVSGAVTIPSNNRKTMIVNLGTQYGFILQVKGVSYALSFDANLVQDSLNNPIAAHTGTTLAYAGTNPPFIRVQKESGSVVDGTKQVQTPTGVADWVKNATVSITEQTGANWKKVDPFYLSLPNGEINITTDNVISLTEIATYIKGGRYDGGPTEGGQLQGPLSRNNSNANIFIIHSGWQVPDGYTKYHDSRLESLLPGDPFYVNPYTTYPISYGSPTWGTAGTFVVENLWVDMSSTQDKITTDPGNTAGYLRISKYTTTSVSDPTVALQPRTATIKIDCQTPNATIAYGYNTGTNGDQYNGNYPRSTPLADSAPSVTMPATTGAATTNGSYNRTNHTGTGDQAITLGSTAGLNGYLYGIIATATNNSTSVSTWEKAARSVIQFNNPPFVKNADGANYNFIETVASMNKLLRLWLRGGDGLSGDNSTPGFPLSWNEKDYTPGPSSAQMLTQSGDNWYWITWGVTVPAYFHFIAGTATTKEAAVYGPHDWVYSKNAWSYMKESYPLRPGESLVFRVGTTANSLSGQSQPQGGYEFFGSFTSSRP